MLLTAMISSTSGGTPPPSLARPPRTWSGGTILLRPDRTEGSLVVRSDRCVGGWPAARRQPAGDTLPIFGVGEWELASSFICHDTYLPTSEVVVVEAVTVVYVCAINEVRYPLCENARTRAVDGGRPARSMQVIGYRDRFFFLTAGRPHPIQTGPESGGILLPSRTDYARVDRASVHEPRPRDVHDRAGKLRAVCRGRERERESVCVCVKGDGSLIGRA